MISSPLQLSTTQVTPGTTLTGTATYLNTGAVPVLMGSIYVTSRPPGGTNPGGPFDDFAPVPTNVTLQPGASYIITASRLFTANDPVGSWYAYTTYSDASGVFHDGPDLFFTVSSGQDGGSADAGQSLDAGGPAADGGSYFYGINDHPEWITNDQQEQEMAFLVAAGVETVRIDINWYLVEPSEGQFVSQYIARYDNFIQLCQANNIQVLGILLDTPSWANDGGISPATNTGVVVPPSDLGPTSLDGGPGSPSYNSFVSWAMQRWGLNGISPDGPKWIQAWEIWNEPDGYWAWSEATGTTSPFGAGKSDPVKYSELLIGVYPMMKSIDRTTTVLGVSSSGTPLWMPAPYNEWVTTLYGLGIKDYFDVYSAHVYNGDYNPVTEPTPSPPQDVLARITNSLIPIMTDAGDGAKRVWITETGYYSGGPNDAAQVTADQQAEYLTEAFAYARDQMPTVDRLMWYDTTGSNSGTSSQDYFCILVGPDSNPDAGNAWSPKPAYTAFETIPKD